MYDIGYEIIDFHTHPFIAEQNNICSHKKYCNMSPDDTLNVMSELNITHFCGSVIGGKAEGDNAALAKMIKNNNDALELSRRYNGKYIPGFHVNPRFVRESCEEIERMSRLGVKLIGELVPYLDGWDDYSCSGLAEILDVAEQYGMIVSFHSMGEDAMDKMVKEHPNITFVAAHPGEYGEFMRHLDRFGMSENYYMDISGYGIFRYGMLRHAIDAVGADRILFGSDFPTCSPGMYVGGVLFDRTLSDAEKEKIFSLNAKRLLNID